MNKTIDITPIERTPNIGQTLATELKSLGMWDWKVSEVANRA